MRTTEGLNEVQNLGVSFAPEKCPLVASKATFCSSWHAKNEPFANNVTPSIGTFDNRPGVASCVRLDGLRKLRCFSGLTVQTGPVLYSNGPTVQTGYFIRMARNNRTFDPFIKRRTVKMAITVAPSVIHLTSPGPKTPNGCSCKGLSLYFQPP